MAYKRGKSDTSVPLAKRVKRVERAVRASKPELKYKDYFIFEELAAGASTTIRLTDVDEGPSQGERIGNKIRLKGVHARGLTDTAGQIGIDSYLLLRVGTQSVPTLTSGIGAFPMPEHFHEWHHEVAGNGKSDATLDFQKNFPLGMVCTYAGDLGTQQTKNELIFTMANHTTASMQPNITIRIYYIDN